MEAWVPLFDIFMNSPTPEIEASLWLQQCFNATTLSSSTTTPITASSFLSLLTKPCNLFVDDSSFSSPLTPKRIMFIETLPGMNERFNGKELSKLARSLLSETRDLLDRVSEPNHINKWISGFSLESGEEEVGQEFESLPDWLKDMAAGNDPLLYWLPLSAADCGPRFYDDSLENDESLFSQVEENGENGLKEVGDEIEMDRVLNVPLEPEIENMAASLRDRVINLESSFKAVALGNEIRELCLDKGMDPFQVLCLIEPWKAEDEAASVLISHLSSGDEDELAWPKEPASRLLLTSTIEYSKLHQRAAVHALLFPLVLRKEGINNPICDVITRILRECLHPAHVSAFCQTLLCGGEEERRFILLPCHEYLVSKELNQQQDGKSAIPCIFMQNAFIPSIAQCLHLVRDSGGVGWRTVYLFSIFQGLKARDLVIVQHEYHYHPSSIDVPLISSGLGHWGSFASFVSQKGLPSRSSLTSKGECFNRIESNEEILS
ncbi:hypothetical protein V6Z11_1Z108400 [Gossypium hirsutum]